MWESISYWVSGFYFGMFVSYHVTRRLFPKKPKPVDMYEEMNKALFGSDKDRK